METHERNRSHLHRVILYDQKGIRLCSEDLQGESAIMIEHVDNNSSVREMLGQGGIKPENLPPSEDIKKLERKVQKEDKQLAEKSGKLHE